MVNICELTLKVKHLPNCLNQNEKEEFLKHFGAHQVKIITSLTQQKSIAYGKFETKQQAKAVLQRIHQLRVLDAIICVEYAEKKIADSFPAPLLSPGNENSSPKHFVNYVTKINALNSAVGYDQPPPAHLKYAYPRANRATIHNISYALETVPQFYYQVLHLMNRMNLPPPFSHLADSVKPTLRPALSSVPMQSTQPEKSDSESEIESDSENKDKQKLIIPVKRQLSQRKLMKRPKFIKPTATNTHGTKSTIPVTKEKRKDVAGDVFEKRELKKVEKIELIVDPDCLDQKNVKDELHSSTEVGNNEISESVGCPLNLLTDEELAANRIPLKDLYVLPIFKDYHPGSPNSKLYIKNIAKTVTVADLERIYKRFNVEKAEGEPNLFEIKLMTEGRMKGQAFITLESVELGQRAVKETNGFILKDKPLVVVFAKTPANKR